MKFVTATVLALTLSATSAMVLAGPQCTAESTDKWQDQAAFQDQLKAQGYQIKKFKVTSGNCYEIYGHDKDGKKVEIYFNPVDGAIVKHKFED